MPLCCLQRVSQEEVMYIDHGLHEEAEKIQVILVDVEECHAFVRHDSLHHINSLHVQHLALGADVSTW